MSGRAVILDPNIKWWLDDLREYWHEASGIFLRGPGAKFLLLHRRKYPFAWTVPAGHVNTYESPYAAALRELREETGVEGVEIRFVGRDCFRGDECRRGADCHEWNTYLSVVEEFPVVVIGIEAARYGWFTLDEALALELAFATRKSLQAHSGKLRS